MIERFPMRRVACIWLLLDCDGWLVLARDHGWLHGDYCSALADARWLAGNLGLPVRVMEAAA
jgi:hypothetical protein